MVIPQGLLAKRVRANRRKLCATKKQTKGINSTMKTTEYLTPEYMGGYSGYSGDIDWITKTGG